MELHTLLHNIKHDTVHNDENIEITSLHNDSREVEQGGLFFAVRGTILDGHDFIDTAISNGASAIVCEEFPDNMHDEVRYVRVEKTTEVMGPMASIFYGEPSQKLHLVGVTGTNGKTTVATLLYELFEKLGYRTGLISTIGNKIHETTIPATHTTPDALLLHRMFADMVEVGCTHCFMEVSSHALEQGRVNGIDFTGAVFMNITHDHIDYHGTFERYMTAKKKLFDTLHPHAWALANADDENGAFILQNTRAVSHLYSMQSEDESFSGKLSFEGNMLANTFDGITMTINGTELHSNLIGRFNAYNLLAVFGTARMLNEDTTAIVDAIAELHPAPGRFEVVRNGETVGIVDYAHTPDALENVLRTISDIKKDEQKIITVIGCGGDRDTQKRPIMARIAESFSDRVVLTSDNPRTEDPLGIINDMKQGLDNRDNEQIHIVPNREEAIDTAVYAARPTDIVLVAGKGHETYQIIGEEKIDFDDRKVLREKLGKYK